jgi:glutamate-1-semialdehyde 2,1-aminomutase
MEVLNANKGEVGAIILEPFVGNSGFIRPTPEFLSALEDARMQHDLLIMFDEVMTGFRVGKDSAQGVLKFKPDLSMFGKVIGGGMPIGAYGGRADIMDMVAPAGPVYQAGTLSGNPVAVTAGLTTLSLCNEADYEDLHSKASTIAGELAALGKKHGHPIQTDAQGGMLGFVFSETLPQNFEQAAACDHKKFAKFFHAMLAEGVYLPPSGYEACFLSFAHTDADIDFFLAKADKCLASLASS